MDFVTAKKYLTALLQIDSVESDPLPGKPFGEGVHTCLETALRILQNEEFRVKNGNGYYGFGEIGEGDLFGILCHLDVVPVGKGWTYPPFGAEEHDGKIYARGALDDKGPFVAALYALTRLLDDGYVPKMRIRMILGCDEESGWKCMDAYQENEEMPSVGISPDGDFPVINCEKGIVYHSIRYLKSDFYDYLQAGERANMTPAEAVARVRSSSDLQAYLLEREVPFTEENGYVTIKTFGVSSHGSHPEKGDNALLKVLDLLAPFDGMAKEVRDAFGSYDGKGIGLCISDEKSGSLTLNLGIARTEGNEIIFHLDVRHPVDYPKEYVTAALRKGLTGTVEETFFHLPLYVDKEHPLVTTLLAAYNKITGENAQPLSIGGGTYARVLPMGVAFGPCFPESKADIHCADEYIDLQEFKTMSDIYYEAFKNLCFVPNK